MLTARESGDLPETIKTAIIDKAKMINTVTAALREHISDRNVSFVFPSQTSASLWARKTCTLGIARSVAANRFLAWDRFKEEAFCEKEAGRVPASAVMRQLFAESLIRKNAAANLQPESHTQGFPLKSLIPPEYAKGGRIFAPFMARLLPSLAWWEKLMNSHAAFRARDAEDEDYETVKKEYTAFLERFGLFEPSWEEKKLCKEKKCFLIFFPGLIEDFAEYDSLLTAPQFICVQTKPPASQMQPLVCYQSAREEIRAAVMELQRLHEEEGLPYEDMAVSVPELEEMEPYLLREFTLRHIPFIRRAGKKLGETGAGRFFSLVNECASSRFSFKSLKALILNDHIPWKDGSKNKALVKFGIEYNCVSSYIQNGGIEDIWEEAFKEAGSRESVMLLPYYREVKKRILSLAGSKSFAEIRKNYFAFRNNLLDMEKISEEDDAVLSRCIVELGSLIDLEEKFNEPALVPASPFGFFLSCLNEKEYVRAGKKPGINIFKWRVAAASPFSCHFVLNASQAAATVLSQPMKFLRQDKRKALGLEDRDASGSFFLLCDTGRTRISASAQAFSGWAIPHSFFAQGRTVDALPCHQDPYRDERLYHKGTLNFELQNIFPIQKRSFEQWKNTLCLKKNDFSFFSSQVPLESGPAQALLKDAVLDKDGFITVSPTGDLNVYYECPVKWLYKRIFKANEFSLEAALLDDTALGLLYHKILEKLFARIKDEDVTFDSGRLDTYKRWAFEITRAAIEEAPAFRGPLAVPLVSPQAAGMAKKLANLLEIEARDFNGYEVAELELPVGFKRDNLYIKGIIDRVSASPQGEPVIIDYKTTYLPDQTNPDDLEKASLKEFQMPLYIKLYEASLAEKAGEDAPKVQGAYFYSINLRKIKTAMGETSGGRSKVPGREEYEPFLEAAEKKIAEFGQKVNALDFVPREIRVGNCLGCVYKTVCRKAYFLNRRTR
ncbi:MAG: PD-(D/E)XK nuclease family protein [Treponema sp.]|jgi:hypothetical protein|nr:PD-(D/E)XK nuclease family protein [Treponema sp.]